LTPHSSKTDGNHDAKEYPLYLAVFPCLWHGIDADIILFSFPIISQKAYRLANNQKLIKNIFINKK
jgi:hypothetical protein